MKAFIERYELDLSIFGCLFACWIFVWLVIFMLGL